MMPKERMTKVLVAVVAVALVIVGVILWKAFAQKSAPAVDGPVAVAARPLAEYEPASNDAVAVLTTSLAAGDDTALPSAAVRAKNALMGLTVPADARAAHLALILALSRFEQDPSPEARAALAVAVEAFSR